MSHTWAGWSRRLSLQHGEVITWVSPACVRQEIIFTGHTTAYKGHRNQVDLLKISNQQGELCWLLNSMKRPAQAQNIKKALLLEVGDPNQWAHGAGAVGGVPGINGVPAGRHKPLAPSRAQPFLDSADTHCAALGTFYLTAYQIFLHGFRRSSYFHGGAGLHCLEALRFPASYNYKPWCNVHVMPHKWKYIYRI